MGVVASIREEYGRYKGMAEKVFAQLEPSELTRRPDELAPRDVGKEELLRKWEQGWTVLFETLSGLDDDLLTRTVSIRGRELSVVEALHRSLAHVAYHVGQMVSLGRTMRGASWGFITIPPGGTEAYNRAPHLEKPAELR